MVEYDESKPSLLNDPSAPSLPRSDITRIPNTEQVSMEFMDLNITPKSLNQMQKFLQKMPKARVQLSKEQRQRLIQVLKGSCDEDEDILLSLDPAQTKNVVHKIIGKPNVSAALDDVQMIRVLQNQEVITLFPKDFFALLDKGALEGSKIKAYPKSMFDRVKFKPMMLRKPVSENGNQLVRDYGKTVGDLVEERFRKEEDEEIARHEKEDQENAKASESGEAKGGKEETRMVKGDRLAVYPQEMFDLVQAIGASKGDKDLLNRATEIFPEDMIPLLEQQPARMEDSEAPLYPEEIFEIGDQEKVICERVALFARQILQTVNDEAVGSLEAKQRNHDKNAVVLYPEGLHQLMDRKFGNLLKLEDGQRDLAVEQLGENAVGQVVLSDLQMEGLLERLEGYEEKDELDEPKQDENEKSNEDNIENENENKTKTSVAEKGFYLDLEPDQILDIMNQNCRVKGVQVQLTPEQIRQLRNKPQTARPTLQGAEYYDCDSHTLIDARGNRLELDNVTHQDKAFILDHLKEDRFAAVISKPKSNNQPSELKVIEEAFYDPFLDGVIDHRDDVPIYAENKTPAQLQRQLRNIEMKNLRPLESVLDGEAYYDAVVDEMVDRGGERHGLKDLTMQQVRELVEQNGRNELPVVVQPEKKTALLLDNVWYVPVEDSLMNGKGHKTVLTDLRPEERLRLIENLGARKGTPIDMSKVKLGKKRRGSDDSKRGSGKLLNEDKQRDLDDLIERMSGDQNRSGSPSKKKKSGSKKKKRNYSSRDPKLGDTLGNTSRGSPKASIKSSRKRAKPRSEEEIVKEKFLKNAKKTGKGKVKKGKKKSKNKEKREEPEPVLVRDLRDSQKNPLLKKLMEDERKNKKKKKKKKAKKKGKKIKEEDEDEEDPADEFIVTETEQEGDEIHFESAQNPKTEKELRDIKTRKNMNSEDINNAIDMMSEGDAVTGDEGDTIDKLREDDLAERSRQNSDNQFQQFNEYDTFNKKDNPDVVEMVEGDLEDQYQPSGFSDKGAGSEQNVDDQENEGENDGGSEHDNEGDEDPDDEGYDDDKNEHGNDNEDETEADELQLDQTIQQKLGSGGEGPNQGQENVPQPEDTFTNEVLVQELKSESQTEKDHQSSMNRTDSRKRRSTNRENKNDIFENKGDSFENRENSFEMDLESDVNPSPKRSNSGSKFSEKDSQRSPKRTSKKRLSKNSQSPKNESTSRKTKSKQTSKSRNLNSENQSPERRLMISESGKVLNIKDSTLRRKVEQVFDQERQKMSDEIMERCQAVIRRKTGIRGARGEVSETEDDNLIDDFFLFCKEQLPTDPKYKESMMFVSLFYYYLDKNQMLKKPKGKRVRRGF